MTIPPTLPRADLVLLLTDTEAAFSEQRDDLRQQQHDVIDQIAETGLRG